MTSTYGVVGPFGYAIAQSRCTRSGWFGASFLKSAPGPAGAG